MKNAIKLSVLTLIFLTTACSEEVKSEEPSSNEKKEVIVQDIDSDTEKLEELHLHGDVKWIVSEHMVEHIATVDSLVKNYNVTSEKSPNELALEIDEELKMVTQTCDMTGEAHAQLHLWLLPFWNLIDQLKESTDPENQVKLLEEMKNSVVLYHTYFE